MATTDSSANLTHTKGHTLVKEEKQEVLEKTCACQTDGEINKEEE